MEVECTATCLSVLSRPDFHVVLISGSVTDCVFAEGQVVKWEKRNSLPALALLCTKS
jgi:hypothetical protein